MQKERLEKLQQFSTASFARWPFDARDVEKFHADIVILGLNPSVEIRFGENFHKKRFDLWYEEGFSKAPFAGAYMTDLMSHHEPLASIMEAKWKNDEIFKREEVKCLEQQFALLGARESTPIVCIGQNTMRIFSSIFPQFLYVFGVSHPNSYRMKGKKDRFLSDLRRIGTQIEQCGALETHRLDGVE